MSETVIIRDTATPMLNKLVRNIERPRELITKTAGAVRQRLRRHFSERQAEGNKRGWPHRYFWRGAKGQSVYEKTEITSVSDEGATITIASPEFVHKLKGGTIKPKRGKFLAIPMNAAAYEAGSPREGGIPDLFVARRKGSSFAVLARREGGKLVGYYRLLRSVTQAPDTRAMPQDGELETAAEKAAAEWAQRKGIAA
jgi:hypothetical protein